MNYGFDIGAERADDLDMRIIEAIKHMKFPSVLDLGSGRGGQTKRMTDAGATVTAVDIADYSDHYTTDFTQSDALSFVKNVPDKTYDVTCAQRMIHYLPHDQAIELLQHLRRITRHSLYISVTGLESAVGRAYSDKAKPIEERLTKLDPEEQTTFGISEPLCLYARDEFIELLSTSGWHIEHIWTSAFGNHKAVCVIENLQI